jgi:hypothetical protein
VELSRGEELKIIYVWYGMIYRHPKAVLEDLNKCVFGRIVGYLNDKDGYQVYVPSIQDCALALSASNQNEFAPI